MSDYKYKVAIHLGAGVIVNYDTDETVDFQKTLESENSTITISGPTNKMQIVPVRNILAIEVTDTEKK